MRRHLTTERIIHPQKAVGRNLSQEHKENLSDSSVSQHHVAAKTTISYTHKRLTNLESCLLHHGTKQISKLWSLQHFEPFITQLFTLTHTNAVVHPPVITPPPPKTLSPLPYITVTSPVSPHSGSPAEAALSCTCCLIMSVQFCLVLLALSSLTAASDPDCDKLLKPLEDQNLVRCPEL